MNKLDSMLEIAMELMKKKRNPHTIQNLAKEVFEIKELKISENLEMYSQFVNDFMLCGNFICCGEDKKGAKIWGLKSRQKYDLVEEDGLYLDDPLEDDEDVKNNELTDDNSYTIEDNFESESSFEDDEEEEDDEKDEIEEEIMLNNTEYDFEEDEDDEEDSYDDSDELVVKNKKR